MPSRKAEYYHLLKSAGICVYCGQEDAEPGKAGCADCLEKKREKNYQRYHGDKHQEYLDKARETARAKVAKLKTVGLCPHCGKRKPEPGYITCRYCLAKMKPKRHETYREKRGYIFPREHRVENGLCYICEKPLKPGFSLCEDCYQKILITGAIGRASVGIAAFRERVKKEGMGIRANNAARNQ